MTITYQPNPERILRAKRPRVDYADRLDALMQARGFAGYVREYRFAAMANGGTGKGLRARLQAAGLKDWRFDIAFVDEKVAIEVDGGGRQAARNTRTGAWMAVGRHGQAEDYDKLNSAQAVLGWLVLRFTLDMLRGERWEQQIDAALESRRGRKL